MAMALRERIGEKAIVPRRLKDKMCQAVLPAACRHTLLGRGAILPGVALVVPGAVPLRAAPLKGTKVHRKATAVLSTIFDDLMRHDFRGRRKSYTIRIRFLTIS